VKNDQNINNHWIDLINENGGRKILSFESMTCTDAFIWSKFRNDSELMSNLLTMTESFISGNIKPFTIIGQHSEICNVKSIRNSRIGANVQINGAEIIDNSIIRSDISEPVSIGHGTQIQNSIIGYGNHIDSGSQLKNAVTGACVSIHQSARISNSFIGDNSAIACCEIANSLLFPSHAQHHNSSFLIATCIGGQSNIASGSTIGSNHNSRTNDGEIWASRGFWPGLCTSFKHNSRFASFTMCAKADYQYELDIPFPFSLISNDTPADSLIIFPAFWFSHNMYSFMRSKIKFVKRDRRIHKEQIIEHDPLAPDTIEEIIRALTLLEEITGKGFFTSQQLTASKEESIVKGRELLSTSRQQDLVISGQFEKSNRKIIIKKTSQAWNFYHLAIRWYAVQHIITHYIQTDSLLSVKSLTPRCTEWVNCGGQIISTAELENILNTIKSSPETITWQSIHLQLQAYNKQYAAEKYNHALSCVAFLEQCDISNLTEEHIKNQMKNSLEDFQLIKELTFKSRAKDHIDPFRKLPYNSEEEMNAVLGKLDDDTVIKETRTDIDTTIKIIESILKTNS
jgi:carbonic anhydrase/acetyltransferase-like protein (isoleucine patch superfamily)